jgi:dehydrogenase/reductase SDR family member 7B
LLPNDQKINFLGPVALTQNIASSMIAQGGGMIGVISSVQGKIGIPYRTSYAASKHALQGYFDGLRSELADKNITVTTVSPGYVNTSLSLNALNADGTKYNKTDETTASGMSPSELSEKILLNMANGVADIVVADAKTCIGILLKVLMPQLFASMMKKRISK